MSHILLVEDDPVLGRGLSVNLEQDNYSVHWVQDLASATKANDDHKFNLILLDLGLPDGSGLSLLENIRKNNSRLPIIILTARTDEDSIVKGFQLGANDYIKKPFGQRELFARIKATLREPSMRDEQIRYGNLLVLIDNRQVLVEGKPIDLNRREFDIFLHFIQNADKVVSRDSLIQTINKDGEIFDRTIDSHVSHLRSKLRKADVGSVKISSVYGLGYRLEKKL